MGWTDARQVSAKPGKKGWHSRGGWRGRRPDQTTKRVYAIPRFSTDPAAARLLEDEIERRGLQMAYTAAMIDVLGLDPGIEMTEPAISLWLCRNVMPQDLWTLIRATPEQKARAFLAAVSS